MNYTFKKFKNYCNDKGIDLIRDDLKFIEESLNNIPLNLHSVALRGYIAAWRDSIRRNKDGTGGINLARKDANQFLLFFVPK